MCAFEVHVQHTRVSFSLRLHEEPDASPAERTLSVCACVCKREESGRACQAGDGGISGVVVPRRSRGGVGPRRCARHIIRVRCSWSVDGELGVTSTSHKLTTKRKIKKEKKIKIKGARGDHRTTLRRIHEKRDAHATRVSERRGDHDVV